MLCYGQVLQNTDFSGTMCGRCFRKYYIPVHFKTLQCSNMNTWYHTNNILGDWWVNDINQTRLSGSVTVNPYLELVHCIITVWEVFLTKMISTTPKFNSSYPETRKTYWKYHSWFILQCLQTNSLLETVGCARNIMQTNDGCLCDQIKTFGVNSIHYHH